jgi:hypothetical protein
MSARSTRMLDQRHASLEPERPPPTAAKRGKVADDCRPGKGEVR